MIAATARAYGAPLATRNGRDFVNCGVTPIDPGRRRTERQSDISGHKNYRAATP